jgi:hypothetical protein
VEEQTKSCSGMTFTFLKQLWTLTPSLYGKDHADALLNAKSMVEQLQAIMGAEYSDTIVKLHELKHCGGNDYTAVYNLEGTQLPSHKVAASSARLFARDVGDEDDYSRALELEGPFDLRNYTTAERFAFDDSNIVLVQLTPWDNEVNHFATQVFKREVRGNVVAASLFCMLALDLAYACHRCPVVTLPG